MRMMLSQKKERLKLVNGRQTFVIRLISCDSLQVMKFQRDDIDQRDDTEESDADDESEKNIVEACDLNRSKSAGHMKKYSIRASTRIKYQKARNMNFIMKVGLRFLRTL